MDEKSEDLKRVVRTAVRSIEVARSQPHSDRHLVAAVQHLAFAVDKLIDALMRTKTE
jgi:hypothetical protein